MNGDQIKIWADKRIASHRADLETNISHEASISLRAKIEEIKELLDVLRNEPPPVWSDASII